MLDDNVVPRELIEKSREFRPECLGIDPPHGVWCHVCGTDLVRDADGTVYVLEDNLRVPSGVSYMLENREVMKRVFPELFDQHAIYPIDDYPEQLARCLRSLSPRHPDYKPQYHGDLRARDAAYHQGTVWAWLVGPFIDAWLKVHPADRAGARRWLDGFDAHLSEVCVGSISEIFDAEEPYRPRGCIAQAWGVAELLRAWKMTGSRT